MAPMLPLSPQVDGRSGIATPTGIAAAQTVAGWWPVALWRSDRGAALPGARRHLLGRDLAELAVWPGPSAHPEHQVTIGRIITEVDELRGIALRLAEADADAFTAATGAHTLSQSTQEEKAGRSAAHRPGTGQRGLATGPDHQRRRDGGRSRRGAG